MKDDPDLLRQFVEAMASDGTRPVKCRRCGESTELLVGLYEFLKRYNRRLADEAPPNTNTKPNYISQNEVAVCDPCLPFYRAECTAESEREFYTTSVYLRELKAGRHNPESRAWLRRHGYGAEVDRAIGEEGTNGL